MRGSSGRERAENCAYSVICLPWPDPGDDFHDNRCKVCEHIPLSFSLPPHCLYAPLAHSHFFTLSCNLFLFLFFTLFYFVFFAIPFSCCLPKFIDLWSGSEKGHEVGGTRGRLSEADKLLYYTKNPTPTTQLSHFFSFVKFTSAIPEIMSNIPRAMPKKKKKNLRKK